MSRKAKDIEQYVLNNAPPPGESVSVSCPVCKAEHEKSFCITNENGQLLYICFRASCNPHWNRGAVHPRGPRSAILVNHDEGEGKKKFVPRAYECHTNSPSSGQVNYFGFKYGLSAESIYKAGIRYNPSRDSFVFPIFNYLGEEIGVVDRAFWGRTPKALTYYFKDEPKIHFASFMKHNTTIVVEDHLSAIKVASLSDNNVVAVLTSELREANARHLSELGTKHLIMMLDPDALSMAIRSIRKVAIYFSSTKIINLKQDPKDTPRIILGSVLNGE